MISPHAIQAILTSQAGTAAQRYALGSYAKWHYVATVPLVGPLSKDDYAEAGAAVRNAAKSRDVAAVVIVVDSPGGAVAGCNDLAETIREAAAWKPVVAVVEDLCCSAALCLGRREHRSAETSPPPTLCRSPIS